MPIAAPVEATEFRKLSRRNASESTSLDTDSKVVSVQPVTIALSEGRGPAPEIGLASFNQQTSECVLSQLIDTPTFSHVIGRLSTIEPSEVQCHNQILLSATCSDPPTKLFHFVSTGLETTDLVLVGRSVWNEAQGLRFIHQYGIDSPHFIEMIQDKSYV
jgi:hypothetical protein